MKTEIYQANIIDTHAMVESYIKVGFTKQQAEMMTNRTVEFVNSNLATKTDIRDLRNETQKEIALVHKEIALIRKDIEQLRDANKQDMEKLRHANKQDMEKLRSETKKDILALEHKIETLRKEGKSDREALRKDMTIKMGGMAIVIITVLGVLIQI